MNTREYCCYTRPYSEIEGLQLAHTLIYSASAQPEGIVLELRVQQGGGSYTSRVVCPDGPLAVVEDEPGEENSREFVPFAGFNTENLLHNTELTQSV